jgi:hypothetical protein
LHRKGWRYSDDEEDTMIIKMDISSWQLGLHGEEAPRSIDDHDWAEGALDMVHATALVERFVGAECHGVLPRNVLFILQPHTYSQCNGWDVFSDFALRHVGFHAFLTVDSRHTCLYASGRRTGLVVDISSSKAGSLALVDGYILPAGTKFCNVPDHGTDKGPHSVSVQSYVKVVSALVQECLQCVAKDCVRELLSNVYIAGTGLVPLISNNSREAVASALFESIQSLVKSLAAPDSGSRSDLEVKVILPAEYKYASWIGGSVLAGLSLTQISYLTLHDAQQHQEQNLWAAGAESGRRGSTRQQGLLRRHLFGRVDGPNSYWELVLGENGGFDESAESQLYGGLVCTGTGLLLVDWCI